MSVPLVLRFKNMVATARCIDTHFYIQAHLITNHAHLYYTTNTYTIQTSFKIKSNAKKYSVLLVLQILLNLLDKWHYRNVL